MSAPAPVQESPRWGWLERFVVLQAVLPAILFLPGTQAFRLPIRIAPFMLSLWLMMRAFAARGSRISPHPARPWLAWAFLYMSLMLLHPNTNTLVAGLAQIMVCLSIAVPVYWAPREVRSVEQLPRLLNILLVCNGINAVVGVLQVFYPDTWMPREFSRMLTEVPYGLERLTYIGPGGDRILRPPGLSDSPGAASAPGMAAAFLGIIVSIGPTALWRKALSLFFAAAGLTVIYLTHVRMCLIILGGMLLVYFARTAASRWHLRAVLLLGVVFAVDSLSFKVAHRLGGDAVADRFATLVEDDPFSVYYKNRGAQVVGSLEHMENYPFGAGLGRWGMMHAYFGDGSNPDSPPLWTDVQISGWIFDGGLILLALYLVALLAAAFHDLKATRYSGDPRVQFWANVILALNAGTFALIFGFVPFVTQVGMQFWFLTGVLKGATELERR